MVASLEAQSLPRLPFVVVDQNVLRKPAVIHPLIEEYHRSGQQLLLSWSAHYELSKGTPDTFLQSTKLLAATPSAVSVAFESVGLHGFSERRFRKQVTDVIDHGSTRNLRDVLDLLSAGGFERNDYLDAFAQVAARARAEMARHESDLLFRNTVKSIAGAFSPTERNRVRNGLNATPPDRQPFRQELLPTFTQSNLHDLLLGCGVPFRTAKKLMRFPSLVALNIMTKLAICFRWLVMGGIETTKQSMDNEIADTENIVMSLYGRGLASLDDNALAHREDLSFFVRALWG